jgi:hypothetical protein
MVIQPGNAPSHRTRPNYRDFLVKIKFWLWAAFLFSWVFLGLSSHYHLVKPIIPHSGFSSFTDQVSFREQQLRVLKPFLPARGTIGFLSDRDEVADFYQTQYALSPLLISKDPLVSPAIGIIYDPSSLERIAAQNRMRVVRTFENGLVLLERSNR